VNETSRCSCCYLVQNAWWQMGNQSAPWCVGSWEANGRVPMGVPAFQKAFGLPFQLYAPYFCSDSAYLQNWTMVQSDRSLPGCKVGLELNIGYGLLFLAGGCNSRLDHFV
jgi:hypothetical protein